MKDQHRPYGRANSLVVTGRYFDVPSLFLMGSAGHTLSGIWQNFHFCSIVKPSVFFFFFL